MPPTILVVDDEEPVREVMKGILEFSHYAVTVAANGREALGKLNTPFDLVITDLVMPDMEGLEFIKLLKRSRPHIKILAMSGAFGGKFLKVARFLGVDAILDKPFRSTDVLQVVGTLLTDQPPPLTPAS